MIWNTLNNPGPKPPFQYRLRVRNWRRRARFNLLRWKNSARNSVERRRKRPWIFDHLILI